MQLSFDSLNDLKDFIDFLSDTRQAAADHIAKHATSPEARGAAHDATATESVIAAATGEQIITAPAALTGAVTGGAPARRGRKPRVAPVEPTVSSATDPNAELTAASLTGEAPGAAANQGDEQQAPVVTDIVYPDAEKALEDVVDVEAAIVKRAAELGEVEPVKHLNESRQFIANHGMKAYSHSQTLAGVGENAIAYSSQERARHTAAMEFFANNRTLFTQD